MTVSTTISKSGPYNSGTTGPFSYAFYITDEDELRVILTSAAGVETDLTLTTDYTVAGVGEAAGGTVTLVEAPDFAGGELLTLKRAVPQVQETEIRNQGAFYPAVHEAVFDRLQMQIQDVTEAVERSVKVQVSSDTDPDDLVDTIIAAEGSASADAATATAQAAIATTKAGEAAASAASIALPLAIASGGTGTTTAAGARTALELGTAAVAAIGVAAGNVVQVDQALTTTASATTTTLGTSLDHLITGTATITAFAGVAGVTYHCRADGAHVLTHHATDLIITQGGASITTAAGDTYDVQMITGTTCRVVNYVPAFLPGMVVQRVIGASTTNDTTTSTTAVNSSLAATITPKYANSIILVTAHIPVRQDVNAGPVSAVYAAYNLRNSTDDVNLSHTLAGCTFSGGQTVGVGVYSSVTLLGQYVVNSLAARTFVVQHASSSTSVTSQISGGIGGAAVITLEEIKQ